MNKTTAILLAAGKSERFGSNIPKPFLLLNKKAVYRYSLDILLDHPQIDEIILVLPEGLLSIEKEKLKKEKSTKTIHLIAGGKTRFESVQNALSVLDNSVENVIIHDAARPFITSDLIDNCLKNLSKNKAVSCALESTDTLVFTKNNLAESYPDRGKIMCIQTPQSFQVDILKIAYSLAQEEGKTNFTDDSSLIYYFKLAPVYLVPGSEENIKITYPKDLLLAEFILKNLKGKMLK